MLFWPFTTILIAALLTLAVIDLRSYRLPDILTIPLILVGLGASAATHPETLAMHVTGAAVGYGWFWLGRLIYANIRGRTGLGLGDAKLLAAAGAWLGPFALPTLVLIASILALAFAGARVFVSGVSTVNRPLPFGPFLGATFAALWWYQPYGALQF